jgi:hypothetical protein
MSTPTIAEPPELSVELARRSLHEEQQAAEKAALPAARARLERLIEWRAQARAEEMYEERKRLELEAVKAEMAEAAAAEGPPAGQVDLEEMIHEDERRRITRELEGL